MKKLMQKTMMTIALIVATLTCASNLMAQNVNMSRYITLTVKSGKEILLSLKAASANTPVRIESGSNKQDINVGTLWTGSQQYTAGSSTMTIYGDVIGFDCNQNKVNVTVIDISNNKDLTELYCDNNNLTALDISKNTKLTDLSCHINQLTSLDVSHNTALTYLCCSANRLNVIDVSKNKELTLFSCDDNNLTALDISNNTALNMLFCVGNQLDDCTLDDIFRSLPSREASDNANVFIKDGPSTNPGTEGCRTPIANAKNWKVMDFNYNDPIEINNTVFTCTTSNLIATKQSVAVSLYPNPVEDVLHISSEGEIRSIRIYDTYGKEVAATATARTINLAHLPSGVYAVRVETDKGIGTRRVVKK